MSGRSSKPPAHGDILIVDDKPANLSLLSTMLSHQGYEIRAAISGAIALMACRASAPDLILLDINMPEMDGYEVCRRIKEDPATRGVPVIFLSALASPGDKLTAFGAGGVDYITKPFQLSEVLARVATHLTLHRQRKELERQRKELEERYRQIEELQSIVKGYLSKSAWESIESSATSRRPSAPVRERLTVLMTDIAGFTRLSEQLNPGPLLADLSHYLAVLSNVVHCHHGEVDKYLGDGMLAFFKDPSGALTAACDVQRHIEAFNRRQLTTERPIFQTRIGLATGLVVLASIGSSRRHEFTLIGDRVNVAARLQEKSPLGGILMDEATFVAAGSPAYATPRTMELRGKQDAETMYEVSSEAVGQVLPEIPTIPPPSMVIPS